MILLLAMLAASDPAAMRAIAREYYDWRNRNDPVTSSDQGLHTWDDALSDPAGFPQRRRHVEAVLAEVKALQTQGWNKDDRVDAILLRAQLEGDALDGHVLQAEESKPGKYVDECASAIFSLLKKEYAPARTRVLSATQRLRKMPAFLEQAKKNLTRPVALYARLAVESARGGDRLYTDSLMTLARDLSGGERDALVQARDGALAALHGFASWLEERIPQMAAWAPMGRAHYEEYLHRVYLLPIDADQLAMLGVAELNRYRGLESLLADPAMASPDPARAAHVPADQQAFLAAYQAREEEMLTRQGLYAEGSAAQGQVLRLSRYRAARVGADVNLHTGKWSFEEAVRYFMEAGGLDREAAEGEAAGAAASPLQKITYITGK